MKPEKLVLIVALTALVTSSLIACRRVHQRRLKAALEPKPEALQAWECEGGNLKPLPQER